MDPTKMWDDALWIDKELYERINIMTCNIKKKKKKKREQHSSLNLDGLAINGNKKWEKNHVASRSFWVLMFNEFKTMMHTTDADSGGFDH